MPQILSLLLRLRIFRQDADFSEMFMVSYDVVSPFTITPLSETIDLAASMPHLILLFVQNIFPFLIGSNHAHNSP